MKKELTKPVSPEGVVDKCPLLIVKCARPSDPIQEVSFTSREPGTAPTINAVGFRFSGWSTWDKSLLASLISYGTKFTQSKSK